MNCFDGLTWNAKAKSTLMFLVKAPPQIADTIPIKLICWKGQFELMILTEIPGLDGAVDLDIPGITLGLQFQNGAFNQGRSLLGWLALR